MHNQHWLSRLWEKLVHGPEFVLESVVTDDKGDEMFRGTPREAAAVMNTFRWPGRSTHCTTKFVRRRAPRTSGATPPSR